MHRRAPTALLLGGLALHACGSAPRRDSAPPPPPSCVVERVADGDTFTCRDGRRVRLLGMDTPELAQGEPGRQSHAALRRLLPRGATVRLERDVAARDRFGRELAYVWAGSRMVNEILVREGWAMVYTLPPNVKYAERLERAQKAARSAGAGLWETGGFECSPLAYRRRECVTPGRAAPGAGR